MWVYYYVSKVRIMQLAEQIGSKLPIEEIRQWDVKGTAKANADTEVSKLLSVLGLAAKAGGRLEGDVTRMSQVKFTSTDQGIVEQVRVYLMKSCPYTQLLQNSTKESILRLHDLVHFRGDFYPKVEGDVPERFARFQEMDYVQWEGSCGEIQVRFVTSKDSIVSSSPFLPFLSGEVDFMQLDGFGTLVKAPHDLLIPLLPLFFGREIS